MLQLLLPVVVALQARLALAGEGLGARLAEVRRDSERGAQAVEYAMLGGVAVAIAVAVMALVGGGLLDRLANGIISTLLSFVKSWFGG